jgi:hypothetical protein
MKDTHTGPGRQVDKQHAFPSPPVPRMITERCAPHPRHARARTCAQRGAPAAGHSSWTAGCRPDCRPQTALGCPRCHKLPSPHSLRPPPRQPRAETRLEHAASGQQQPQTCPARRRGRRKRHSVESDELRGKGGVNTGVMHQTPNPPPHAPLHPCTAVPLHSPTPINP